MDVGDLNAHVNSRASPSESDRICRHIEPFTADVCVTCDISLHILNHID